MGSTYRSAGEVGWSTARSASIGRRDLALCLVAAALTGLAILYGATMVIPAVLAVAALVVIVVSLSGGFLLVGLLLLVQAPLLRILAQQYESIEAVRHLDEYLLLALALSALWHARHDAALVRRLVAPLVALGIALIIGVVSTLIHEPFSYLVPLDAFSMSKGMLVLFAGSYLRPASSEVLRVLRALAWLAAALGVFGLLDLILPGVTQGHLPLAGDVAYRMERRCLVSIFANEGLSAWFFAAAACVPLAGFLVMRRRIDLALAVFLVLMSFLSYRRKPVIGLAVALLVILMMRSGIRHKGRIVFAALVGALVILPLIGATLGATFIDAYSVYARPRDAMEIARNAMYIVGWNVAVDHFPLGAGLGQFGGYASTLDYSQLYSKYGLDRVWGLAADAPDFVSDATYPHVLGALGFVGGAAYLCALLLPGWRVMQALKRVRDPQALTLLTAAALVFLEALVESFAAPVFEISLSAYVVYGLCGVALSAAQRFDGALAG